ncbi:metal-dependent hydrolase [Streptococcus varani]|uniref:Metal-dependent hydrolase n=1 Tax=Streptococcus varani TaxID=1608583 RepID=A0A0E4H4C6_9STRE|nr:MBL fold metallo-hydrolase [Streptococcus varani]CQR24508.1 metal-dependent hydrolase [Streptococcus varani]
MTNQKQKQARPPATQFYGAEAFGAIDKTELRWLGNSGLHINSHGTNIMIDPVVEDFDMPLLIDMPITSDKIPHLDAVLITHDDNDHFSQTFRANTKETVDIYHAPHFVAGLIQAEGLEAQGHDIGSDFTVGNIDVEVTRAWHNWKSDNPKYGRKYAVEDLCGFYIRTVDGSIYVPGDSKALPEQYEMEAPDAIFFDWSDNFWHIGFLNAVRLANAYPNADLICQHWGTVDAPDMNTFNMDPADLYDKVIHPERIRVLAPGQAFTLGRK